MSLRKLIGSTLVATVLLASTTIASAASILLYDENTSNDIPQQALSNLGMAYTVAGSGNFNSLLTTGGPWDLVIMDVPSTIPSGGFSALGTYIAGGGRAMLSYWDLDIDPSLASAFEASVASSFTTPQNVHSWNAGHPVWAGVGSLTSWNDIWGDNGDRLNATGSGVALGGFVPGAGTLNEAAIVLGNGGRTIVNGFLFDEINDTNGVRLVENEIRFLLDGTAVPEPGTLALFGISLAGLAAVRRRRS